MFFQFAVMIFLVMTVHNSIIKIWHVSSSNDEIFFVYCESVATHVVFVTFEQDYSARNLSTHHCGIRMKTGLGMPAKKFID